MDFAVVIPTHQRPELLRQAVDSVMRQSLQPTEVVVVCDGADPHVRELFAGTPVRVIEQEKCGVAAARNRGVAATSAEWLCFLDDDDLWHPDRLSRTALEIRKLPDVRAVQAPSWVFSVDKTPEADLEAPDLDSCLSAILSCAPKSDWSFLDIEGHSFACLLERNRCNISTVTIRRDVFEKAGGFPENLTCAEDWLAFLNVARYAEWHLIPDRLSFLRIHAGNNTRTRPLANGLMTISAIEQIWTNTEQPWPPHRSMGDYGIHYRRVVQGAVWDAVRLGRMRMAMTAYVRGCRVLPRWRDRIYALVPPKVAWIVERLSARLRPPVAVKASLHEF